MKKFGHWQCIWSAGLFFIGFVSLAEAQIFVGEGSSVGEFSLSGSVIDNSVVSSSAVNPLGLAANNSGQLFVSMAQLSPLQTTVGSYDFSGAPINSSLITLPYSSFVTSIALDGQGHVFVANLLAGTIGEYTTSGAVVNSALITGLSSPGAMAFDSQGHLFVALNVTGNTSSIGEFTTSGSVINRSLISGIYDPAGLAIDDQGHIFVSEEIINSVAEYSTSGALVNNTLIQNLNTPSGLATDDQGDLFVVEQGAGTVDEYSTSGSLINPQLITGLRGAYNIAVAIPEPSTVPFSVALAGFALIVGWRRPADCFHRHRYRSRDIVSD